MGKKARIKGTEFEINGKIDSPLSTNAQGKYEYVYWGDGFGAFIPKEWIEFYDPPREEPPTYSIEIGKERGNHITFQRRGRGEYDRWYGSSATSDGLTWDELQESYGPTKPMVVVQE